MKKRPKKKVFAWYLPQNLHFLRKKYKLTLDDLTYSTGLSKAFLSQIENGKSQTISIQTAAIICGEFGRDIRKMCFTDIRF